METQSRTALSCGTDYYAPQDVLWLKSWSVTIQMKATEQYFPVVLIANELGRRQQNRAAQDWAIGRKILDRAEKSVT